MLRTLSRALALVMMTSVVHAHGLDPDRAVVRVYGATVHLVATPSASVCAPFDANGDGTLELDEIQADRAAVLATLRQAFDVRNGAGDTGEIRLIDAGPVHTHDESASGHVRFTLRLEWPEVPDRLRLDYGFAELAPLDLVVVHTTADRSLHEQTSLREVQHQVLDRHSPTVMLIQEVSP